MQKKPKQKQFNPLVLSAVLQGLVSNPVLVTQPGNYPARIAGTAREIMQWLDYPDTLPSKSQTPEYSKVYWIDAEGRKHNLMAMNIDHLFNVRMMLDEMGNDIPRQWKQDFDFYTMKVAVKRAYRMRTS